MLLIVYLLIQVLFDIYPLYLKFYYSIPMLFVKISYKG